MKLNIRDYVSAEQPDHHMTMFNLDPKYWIPDYIIFQSKEKSTSKRLARHRFNIIDVNVNAYSQILSWEQRLERVSYYTMLDVFIGDNTGENS